MVWNPVPVLFLGVLSKEVGLAKEKPERVLPLVWDGRGPKPAVREVPVAIRSVEFMFGGLGRGWEGSSDVWIDRFSFLVVVFF